MEPTLRASRFNDRFTASGLSVADADALIPKPRVAIRARAAGLSPTRALVGGASARPGASALWVASLLQSRPIHVATSTSFLSVSASVHHAGANSSLTKRPPAASPAATRASA